MVSIFERAVGILHTADPSEKALQAQKTAQDWRDGALSADLHRAARPPDQPARPAKPELVPAHNMPKRSTGGEKGRAALFHAVAHIELNAIDLAFDLIARFGASPEISEGSRNAFLSDWIAVGDDEARHFLMVAHHLGEMGVAYGDYPAHTGLWDAAMSTADDLKARLAIAPMVLEARGLDVTPAMARKLRASGANAGADILDVILRDEVDHVAAGTKWFTVLCEQSGQSPYDEFHHYVRTRFKGKLKPPFNDGARLKAGLLPDFYQPLSR